MIFKGWEPTKERVLSNPLISSWRKICTRTLSIVSSNTL